MRNPEIWIILIIVAFLLFGAKKMPDAARGLGRSMRIFKSEMKGMEQDDQQQAQYQAQQAYPPQIQAGPQPPVQQPVYQQPGYQQPAPAPAPVAAPASQSAERPDAQ
jgi:sec-independent protein translocase protein TatA